MKSSYPAFQIHQASRFAAVITTVTFAIVIAAAIGLGALLNMFVFQSFYVDGESMSPTLHTRDRLVISKVERSLARLQNRPYIPERGQIIIINGAASPTTVSRASELIKRVVATPGDTVVIERGAVTITTPSGETLDIDVSLGLDLDGTYTDQPLRVTVPDGAVFVLGDNRNRGGSTDSRTFGVVRSEHIDGRLWLRIMPFANWRVF